MIAILVMKKNSCESCLMPFKNDPGTRTSDRYCSYCFQNGALTYPGHDLREFQRLCYEGMVERGMNRIIARIYAWSIRFAPRWKSQK